MIHHGQGMYKEAVCEMKQKILLILLVLVIIGLIGVGLWWKGVFRLRLTVEHDLKVEPLRPELILTVNGSGRTTITPGTPLVFRLMLRNGMAARTVGAMESRERMKEELDEMVKAKEVTREEADEILKREVVPSPVPAMVITLQAEGFSFEREGTQGVTKLPWSPKIIDPTTPVVVTLDEKQIVYVNFVVAPGETVATIKGTYRVRAYFENKSRGQWKGKVTSNTVVITVIETPPVPTAEEAKEKNLILGEYFLALKEYDRAIESAKQALASAPKSIDGAVLLGKAYEAKGDYKSALESYKMAFNEFLWRNPEAHEPLGMLEQNIRRMERKLGIDQPSE
jgi:hypothetical protein